MDPRERIPDDEELRYLGDERLLERIWTCMPAVIDSYDRAAMTCACHIAVKVGFRQPDNTTAYVNVSQLVDCPVIFPTGGGYTLTFPIKPDDECLVFFADRCIDLWWENSAMAGPQGQAEWRMHDLSDGFVLAGARSQPRVLDPNPDPVAVQLRSDDGAAFVEIRGYDITAQTPGNIAANAQGTVVANAGGNMTASAGGTLVATSQGDMTANTSGNLQLVAAGNISLRAAQIVFNGTPWATHTHDDVTSGPDDTGGVVT